MLQVVTVTKLWAEKFRGKFIVAVKRYWLRFDDTLQPYAAVSVAAPVPSHGVNLLVDVGNIQLGLASVTVLTQKNLITHVVPWSTRVVLLQPGGPSQVTQVDLSTRRNGKFQLDPVQETEVVLVMEGDDVVVTLKGPLPRGEVEYDTQIFGQSKATWHEAPG